MRTLLMGLVALALACPAYARPKSKAAQKPCQKGENPQTDGCLKCDATPGLDTTSEAAVRSILSKLLKTAGWTEPVEVMNIAKYAKALPKLVSPVYSATPAHYQMNKSDHPAVLIGDKTNYFIKSRSEMIFTLAHEAIHITRGHGTTMYEKEKSYYNAWVEGLQEESDRCAQTINDLEGDTLAHCEDLLEFETQVRVPFEVYASPLEHMDKAERFKATVKRWEASMEKKWFDEEALKLGSEHEDEADKLGCHLAWDAYSYTYEDKNDANDYLPWAGLCFFGRGNDSHHAEDDPHATLGQRQMFIDECVTQVMTKQFDAQFAGLNGPPAVNPKEVLKDSKPSLLPLPE